ncbi:hypothetical protein EZV62_015042 [Acer yangbiense]|uniref:RNase H type-1 domain-containing protein n=1 Tax=Acer yangbiense TaxID=1000413 RepID=A0A5C7HUK3_9ROSI|nr:hypothetical protein EZV62_015042 [Acer yangbiense]
MFDVISWSMNFLQEFRNSNTEPKRKVVSSNIMSYIWILLDKDAYKANCDDVLDHVNGRVGVDMVIRNLDRLVLSTCSMAFEGTFSVKIAKLIAIPRCLQFGNDCGLVLKTIESDEATVVKWINEGYYLDFDFGIVISDILCLRDKMEDVTFYCTRKGANKVAKGLGFPPYYFIQDLNSNGPPMAQPNIEKLYQWILRQQEEGSRVSTVDIVTYLQNELEYGAEEPPMSPRLPIQHQHSQTTPVASNPYVPAAVGPGVRSGQPDHQPKNSVFSNALSSPVRRSLQHYHLTQGGYQMPSGNGPRNIEPHNNAHPQNSNSPSSESMDMHADSPGHEFTY